MASVACINYCLAVIVLLVTLWLPGIIKVSAVTSNTSTTTNNNNSSQLPWFKRESKALAGIRWWGNMNGSTSHCNWDGIGCNEAGSVTSITALEVFISMVKLVCMSLTCLHFKTLKAFILAVVGLKEPSHMKSVCFPNYLYSLFLGILFQVIYPFHWPTSPT